MSLWSTIKSAVSSLFKKKDDKKSSSSKTSIAGSAYSTKPTTGRNAPKYNQGIATKANKIQIKQAIENIFNVKVVSVNTVNSHTKKKRVGKYTGMTNKYKKAIVKLAEGSTISFE